MGIRKRADLKFDEKKKGVNMRLEVAIRKMGTGMIPVLILLVLFVWMAMGTSLAYGASPVATDQKMSLDGKNLVSDVPVYVENDWSLVPARVIVESSGGEVTWDGNTQMVTVVLNGKKVELTMDSKTAYVDGKETTLTAPARLIVVDKKTGGSRAMVPTRFVSESLGFGVGFDSSARVIQLTSPKTDIAGDTRAKVDSVDCTRDGSSRIITLKSSSAMGDYSDFKLSNPTRYAVDIKNTVMGSSVNENIPVTDASSPVTGVRTGQFSDDTIRVVIDLSQDSNPKVEMSADKKTLTVKVTDVQNGQQGNGSTGTTNPTNPIDPTNPGTPTTPVNKKPASLSDVLIVIDPGHGGVYPGSIATQNGKAVLYEKDPNLDIALRLNQKLQAAGLKTMMTHDTDSLCDTTATTSALDLISRSTFANENNATLFISIHNNSADNIPSAKGTETLYNETDGKAAYGFSSKDLATLVQKKMVAYCGTTNRGAKSRPDLSVLRRTEMPAIIVEGAFMSNADDLKLLQSDQFRENYAKAVAEATIEYLNSIF